MTSIHLAKPTQYRGWKADLVNRAFLRDSLTHLGEKLCSLTTPIFVRFPKQTVKKILSGYDPQFEVGGLFLIVPILEDGNRVLEVRKTIFLKNLSSNPERSFFRPELKKDVQRIWRSNLESDKEPYIPIFFHSHPKIKPSYVDINKLLAELSPVMTSEADQRFSMELEIEVDDVKFLVPNALLVQSEILDQQTIIGFFGGGITPTDFSEYFSKMTGKTLRELWNGLTSWIKEDADRFWPLLLLSFLVIGIPAILYPKRVIPLILVLVVVLLGSQIIPISRQTGESIPSYFGVLREEDTIINIPEYI